jgi:polyhydroxyalkanoate synthesis regulator protein
MLIMRRTAEYKLQDHKVHETIMKELQSQQIAGFIEQEKETGKNVLRG